MESKVPKTLSFEGNLVKNWKLFRQQLEIYLVATGKNQLEDKVKVAILLNVIGEEGLEIFNNFKLNEEQKNNFEVVINEFEKYLTPVISEVYERYVCEGVSIDHYFQELKKLAKSCNFGEQVESMIRDRIVLGVRDKDLQEKLLGTKKLTISRAVEIAKNSEAVKKQAKEVAGNTNNKVTVDQVKKNNKEFMCKRCQKKHGPKQCKAYGKQCKKCGKYNHFAVACRNVPNNRRVKELRENDSESDSVNVESVRQINCIKKKLGLTKLKLKTKKYNLK